jgi:GDP-4-dehydro-6-deoxy-D-mannose reductase
MAKILVTGANGFIGSHLIPVLMADGAEVFSVDIKEGDISNKSTWDNYPKAEIVIHLAGKSFVPDSWNDPSAFFKCNLLGTIESLNYCRKYNASLIFLSSYMYGNPTKQPIAEKTPLEANNPYALSKKLSEEACKFYSEHLGINVTVLRVFNVYGPGQPGNFLIPLIINQIKEGKFIRVKDLEPKRDFVFVGDLVRAICLSAKLAKGYNVINIGSGKSYSVDEIISLIQELMGTALPVYSSNERRKDEIFDTISDISLARMIINWTPNWSIKEGLSACL